MKLTIEKAVYGGDGLARREGKAVFVPMALPGEQVEARIVEDRGGFARAQLVDVLDASARRTAAPCPYYGRCGGCQYQHAEYALQLELKREVLLETLGRAHLIDLPPLRLHSAEPFGYRNRIRLHVHSDGALGYRERGSHAILPVDVCPIAAPVLQDAIPALQTALATKHAGQWCEAVTLFTNVLETSNARDALLLTLQLREGARCTQAQFERLCTGLAAQLPMLRGAGLVATAARQTRRGRKRESGSHTEDDSSADVATMHWGEQSLTYRAADHDFRVSIGAFFQGNRFLVDTLVNAALGEEQARTAWDLFSGVGLFARSLAARGSEVTAVEGAPVAAADLGYNLPGARVVATSTQNFLRTNLMAAPDCILLDPPRAGLGTETSAALAAVRSPSVTYVSCDPATLARDLAVLVDAGYTITQLDLLDMFPQTFHLETVAKLRLR